MIVRFHAYLKVPYLRYLTEECDSITRAKVTNLVFAQKCAILGAEKDPIPSLIHRPQ